MAQFILRRLLAIIPVLFFVSLVTFVLMHTAPGGPWDRDPSSRQVDATTQRILNSYYGLDKPAWRQYIAYTIGDFNEDGEFTCGAICGNLGPSYRMRGMTIQGILFDPVEDQPFWSSKFGFSMRLGLLAFSWSLFFGIPLGIIAALHQNSWIDYISLFFATVGISVPNFVMAIFLIFTLALYLDLIPVVPPSWDDPVYWLMPSFVLGVNTMARTTRLTRASMLEVIRQDYIRTARSKGLSEQIVIIRHMIKNALIPVVTILGPALAYLITGAFIIEQMFSFPGMGRSYVIAIQQRDYSMIMGTTLFLSILVAFANLTVDVIYGFLDPRIRLE